MLGIDDLLVGFATGVGSSNDRWFTEKTEESHVSNVIDLLLNLAYFVYLGSIIPWEQYNAPELGLTPWRLSVIAILVIFFRRIPIMMLLKPLIPDIKTWREALFAGHFGPIGVGAIFAAIFAAILLRAELESDSTEPLATLPSDTHAHNYYIIQIVWPLVTFLVITSILVHGSSIAVFTLGKRINTLTLTMSYTQANEEGPIWMNRLPRIQSNARGTMSKSKDDLIDSSDEKLPEYASPGTLGPIGVPGTFLRHQKEEDTPIERPQKARRRGSKWQSGMGPGGPIEPTAITPQRRSQLTSPEDSTSDTIAEKESPGGSKDNEEPDQLDMEVAQEKREKRERRSSLKHVEEPTVEAFEEGDDMIVEDEEGDVLDQHSVKGKSEEEKRRNVLEDEKALQRETTGEHAKGKYHPHAKEEGKELEEGVAAGLAHPEQVSRNLWKRFGAWDGFKRKEKDPSEKPEKPEKPIEHKRGPAHAYQFGNTIIVEDEDGEVVKKYDLPSQPKQRKGAGGGVQDSPSHFDTRPMRDQLRRMGTWAHVGGVSKAGPAQEGEASAQAISGKADGGKKRRGSQVIDPDDDRIRFTVGTGGRRLSKADFIAQIASMDPKARVAAVEDSDVPDSVKKEVRADAAGTTGKARPTMRTRASSKGDHGVSGQQEPTLEPLAEHEGAEAGEPIVRRVDTQEDDPVAGNNGLKLVTSNSEEIPFHNVPASIQRVAFRSGTNETAAEFRRRLALEARTDAPGNDTNTNGSGSESSDSDDDGTERIPPTSSSSKPHHHHHYQQPSYYFPTSHSPQDETAASRRRCLALEQSAPKTHRTYT